MLNPVGLGEHTQDVKETASGCVGLSINRGRQLVKQRGVGPFRGKWYKPKARIVAQGFRDPHLPLLSRDAPVLAKTSLVLILQWAASHGVSLWNGDCKSAFLQGEPDTERPVCIYMQPPKDDISNIAVLLGLPAIANPRSEDELGVHLCPHRPATRPFLPLRPLIDQGLHEASHVLLRDGAPGNFSFQSLTGCPRPPVSVASSSSSSLLSAP